MTPDTPADGEALASSESVFMDAVWDALKADANDLRKQQRILRAFRAALIPRPAEPAQAAQVGWGPWRTDISEWDVTTHDVRFECIGGIHKISTRPRADLIPRPAEPAQAAQVGEPDSLIERLRGRALFLRHRGEIKTPGLLEQAAALIAAAQEGRE